VCLDEASAIIRALQAEYHRLGALVAYRKSFSAESPKDSVSADQRSEDIDTQRTSAASSPVHQPDDIIHALCARTLHEAAFVGTDVARVLFPVDLEPDSIFVDCNHVYADVFQIPRESIIRGCRMASIIPGANFQRMLTARPICRDYDFFVVRNLPGYSGAVLRDAYFSVEYEMVDAEPSDQDGACLKRRRVPKYVQMWLIARGSLPQSQAPSALSLNASTAMAESKTCPSLSINPHLAPMSPSLESPSTNSTFSSFEAALENSDCIMQVGDTTYKPWCPEVPLSPSAPQMAVLQPILCDPERDGSDGKRSSNVAWLSPWDCNPWGTDQGAWIQVEASTAQELVPSPMDDCMEPVSESDMNVEEWCMPTSSFREPTVRYHTLTS